MAFKPNYRADRSERNRAKAAKQQEKQQRREAAAAERRAARAAGEPDEATGPDLDSEEEATTGATDTDRPEA